MNEKVIAIIVIALSMGCSTDHSAAVVGIDRDEIGFVSLFNGKDLTGWYGSKYYYVTSEGTLKCDPRASVRTGDKVDVGNLLSQGEYGDFVIRFEFKMPENGNNGLGIRVPNPMVEPAYDGMCEIQLLDDGGSEFYDASNKKDKLNPYQYTGSIYGIVPCRRDNAEGLPRFAGGGSYLHKSGLWNFAEVRVVGSEIEVWLNGVLITKGDVAKFSSYGMIPDGRKHPGLNNRKGHICWCGHGCPVEWRNIRIKEL